MLATAAGLGTGLAVPLMVQGRANTLSMGATNVAAGAGTAPGNQINLPAGNAGQAINTPASFAVSLFNAAALMALAPEPDVCTDEEVLAA